MDTLDSRAIGFVDCFAHRFRGQGKVQYRLRSASLACDPNGEDDSFVIEIKSEKDKQREGEEVPQHDVTVKMRDGHLVADPGELAITEGAIVLWHAADSSVPGFVVQGESEKLRFNSASLTSDSLYTHAFGVAGTYEWRDTNRSKLGGRVVVRDPKPESPEDCEEWMRALSDGALTTIEGDRAEPSEVQIVAGQTVFFAVVDAAGITITDARLTTG